MELRNLYAVSRTEYRVSGTMFRLSVTIAVKTNVFKDETLRINEALMSRSSSEHLCGVYSLAQKLRRDLTQRCAWKRINYARTKISSGKWSLPKVCSQDRSNITLSKRQNERHISTDKSVVLRYEPN